MLYATCRLLVLNALQSMPCVYALLVIYLVRGGGIKKSKHVRQRHFPKEDRLQ